MWLSRLCVGESQGPAGWWEPPSGYDVEKPWQVFPMPQNEWIPTGLWHRCFTTQIDIAWEKSLFITQERRPMNSSADHHTNNTGMLARFLQNFSLGTQCTQNWLHPAWTQVNSHRWGATTSRDQAHHRSLLSGMWLSGYLLPRPRERFCNWLFHSNLILCSTPGSNAGWSYSVKNLKIPLLCVSISES